MPANAEEGSGSTRAIQLLEETARLFARVAADARKTADAGTIARLEARAREAADRLERAREAAAPVAAPTDSTRASTFRVLIVDDHELAREALISVLRHEPDL